MNDNLRGYAYVSFKNAYNRSMGWSQYAAADKDGLMPTLYEYLEDGLNMFDRSQYDNDIEAKAIIETIIKEMGRSIVELLKGKHSYPQGTDGKARVVTRYDTTLDIAVGYSPEGEEITLGNQVGEVDLGFMQVEDADEMRYRLRVLADRLLPSDMAIVMSYANGEHDTLTAACGGRVGYKSFTKRMKVATRGMVMA